MAARSRNAAQPTPPRHEEPLCSRIARIRQERGLSQAELGEKIGVSQRMMSFYEIGHTRIPAETLTRIAEALKVSINELLGRAPVTRVLKNPRLWKAMKALDALPPKEQKIVVRMIEVFAHGQNGSGGRKDE